MSKRQVQAIIAVLGALAGLYAAFCPAAPTQPQPNPEVVDVSDAGVEDAASDEDAGR